MKLSHILNSNVENLIFILALMMILFFLLQKGAKKQAYSILFYLVVKAEQEFGSGTGKLKYASVVTWFYERMPTMCRFLFSEKQIDGMIESSVIKMKDYLQNSKDQTI